MLFYLYSRSENAKIGADPTLIGAHKWIYSWQPAVEKYKFELKPVAKNLIDNIWTGDDRIRNQDPLEILQTKFSGTFGIIMYIYIYIYIYITFIV